ncbi:MAG: NAD-binding protein [Enhygromyxa sp.]
MRRASIRPARPRIGARSLSLRAGLLLSVYLAGFVGFASGVGVSEREFGEISLWAKAYYALGLFVVGGLDLGTPHGGPLIGRALVWLAYFSAPLITASALIETALRILNPLALRARRLDGHVIVGGAGRLARLYIKRLREQDPRAMIVVVERDPAKARLRELQEIYKALVIIGDVSSEETLEAIGVARARRVMLLTGDDFTNLDAAARISSKAPKLRGRVVAHVSDLGFMRAVPRGERAYEVFNSLEDAARDLVRQRLLARFEATVHIDLVILAGFGRFGQTVLDQLQIHANEDFGKVVLIDTEARLNAQTFAENPGFGDGHDYRIIEGHLRHPEVWQQVDEVVGADDGPPVIVVGTGDEGLNLQVALDSIRRYPDAHVTVRSFGDSPFAAEVAAQTGVLPFHLAELIENSMPASWFE